MQIAQHLPKIVDLISSHATVAIVAPTGSGKSVGIPAAIAARGARCFVTVPTRTAAISLAEYQRSLQLAVALGTDISTEASAKQDPNLQNNIMKLVGYAAEGNVNYGPDTLIAYVTGGHARRKMLSYFSKGVATHIDFCDVLMVDEVHAGSLDNTVIISLWQKAAASQVSVPRLVTASATPVPIIIEPTPVLYTVDLVAFPIEFKYLDKDIEIDDPSGILYIEAATIAANIHRTTPIDTGHILIFAPGSAEVERVASALKELLKDPIAGKSADIIPAFGALKPDDIALIYKQTSPNERKIVIATNIAEMSITISDVGHVIDTMVEKRPETSQSGGFRLTTRYISKDSAKQRAGRTGRTRPGVCYRMCTSAKFESLEDHRPPEIERVPIYETVMELLDVGLSPEDVIKGVDTKRINTAVQLLNRLGMVTNSPTGIVVTEMGHFAPKFHISVRNAAFLWKWIQAGLPLFPGIVVAALIDSYGPSYFWIPRRKDMSVDEYNLMIKDHKEKYFSKYIGYNDLETCLNMWSDLMVSIGDLNAAQWLITKWCRDNSINNKKIRELLVIVQQSVNTARRLGYDVNVGPFTTQGVMTAARPVLLSVYSDVTMIHRRGAEYFNPVTREDYRLDNRDAINKLTENPPKGIIALVTAEIKTQRGIFRIIGFGVDTDVDGLGRPIVERTKPMTPRGPRAITHFRPPPVVTTTEPNIAGALDLLATLNIGGVTQVETPENPLDLLATLQIGTPTVTTVPPVIVAPPKFTQPIVVPPRMVPTPTFKQPTVIPPRVVPTPTTVPKVVPQPVQPSPDINDALALMAELNFGTDDVVSLVPIEQATNSQLDELVVIGSNPAIYGALGEGRIWDRAHVYDLRQYAVKDVNLPNREYYHWIILEGDIVVGYIGLHPLGINKYQGLQLRYFVAPDKQGRGIATSAVTSVVQEFQNKGIRLWILTDPNNSPCIRVADKTGFGIVEQVQIKNRIVNAYTRML